MNKHTLTFGAYTEKSRSDNIFLNCCTQSAYGYNSLADFYADANGFLSNRNRTVSPVTLRAFQICYSNVPGDEARAAARRLVQRGYAQDEWRVRRNLTMTAGLRFDVSQFKNAGFANADADG